MHRLPQLLICDDDSNFHVAIKHSLKGRYECRSAHNADEAILLLQKGPVDILLMDIEIRSRDEGILAIPRIREQDPDVSIVMSSGRTDFEAVRESMRLGAVDYVPKDSDPRELLHVLSRVQERRSLARSRDQQASEVSQQQRQHVMIGQSPPIDSLRRIIQRVKASPANVVIHGQTGTGKEVVARQLRATLANGTLAPFVAVDSSTIQSTMAESLLFGHQKGAFTGAERAVKGIFEEADGGIVYFDEIANMPMEIQAKLLRVIQEREFVRIGSSRLISSEFRVICATNQDLDGAGPGRQIQRRLAAAAKRPADQAAPLRERAQDIRSWWSTILRRQPAARGGLSYTRRRWRSCRHLPGRETSASWATWWPTWSR